MKDEELRPGVYGIVTSTRPASLFTIEKVYKAEVWVRWVFRDLHYHSGAVFPREQFYAAGVVAAEEPFL